MVPLPVPLRWDDAMRLRIDDLHLCETAIHKQFRSCDVAALV
jgi:hypothetical protein